MKPFQTVDYHIKSTWHSLARMYNQIGGKFNISQAMGYVLLNIEREGTPASKIAPLLGMEATSMSRLLKSLENNGLIYKKGDENDKRVVRIFLTEEGVLKKKLAQNVIRKFNETINENIPVEDMAVFFRVIEQINNLTQIYKAENI